MESVGALGNWIAFAGLAISRGVRKAIIRYQIYDDDCEPDAILLAL